MLERLKDLIQEKSFRAQGEFTLASGKASDCFFDMKRIMGDPEGINLLADAFLGLIADEEAAYIGGVAMGAIPVVSVLSLKSLDTARPRRAFFIRKDGPKSHGMEKDLEGQTPPSGEAALLFEDVTTTGGSALVGIERLRREGCSVKTVYTIVDRLEGAEDRFAQEGIRLVALFTKKDFSG
ncbi:MAG: orotate phosphoribosyltransferase [Alphaproteobacteria bacterium]|nr:orotate phosphoribosyltransferase [Alphaproteobacteria bacterium]